MSLGHDTASEQTLDDGGPYYKVLEQTGHSTVQYLVQVQHALLNQPRARGCVHTGVVSENMQGLGAKLRKLPRQAKICTPPGGEVIAKICVCSDLR